MVELISLQPPYHTVESIHVAEKILTSQKPDLPSSLSSSSEMGPIIKFIHQCIEFEPENRPSSSQAVSSLSKILKDLTSATSTSRSRNGINPH